MRRYHLDLLTLKKHFNMTTKFNFKDITGRLEDFVEYFKKIEVDNFNPCKENDIKPSKTNTEDKLYRLFLKTHFQSLKSEDRFIDFMSWEKLNTTGNSKLEKVCRDFFNQSELILVAIEGIIIGLNRMKEIGRAHG